MAQDFVIAQLYWGSTFVPDPQHRTDPTVGLFNWIDMNGAIGALCGSRYFTKLDQYGAGRVILGGPRVDVVGWNSPPSQWGNGKQEDGFTDGDIKDFIVREIDTGQIPGPTDWQEKPIYLVILPKGLFSKDHFLNAVGWHGYFDYQGKSAIYAWIMQGDSLQETTPIIAHEIVEGIGWELLGPDGEIADPCQSTSGFVNGVVVQGYKSREDGGICVIPGQLTIVVHKFPPGHFSPG